MSKELEDALKVIGTLLIALFIMGVALWRIRGLEKEIDAIKNAPADTVTIVKVDTLLIAQPVVQYKYIKEKEYVTITDSLLVYDTVTKIIELPREYLVYKDSTYRAVVSGVQPRLDTMTVFPRTVYQTVTKTITEKKRPHFSLSVGPGVSWDGKKVKPSLQATAGFVIKSW